jgi:hypothetical protein
LRRLPDFLHFIVASFNAKYWKTHYDGMMRVEGTNTNQRSILIQ